MSFAQDEGYIPVSFNDLISSVREGINTQFGTTYTEENFVGTNWYKYAYAIIQKVQEGEVKTSEIFQKLQEYISDTNERIQRPSVSMPGLLEAFAAEGFIASVKPPLLIDAGKVYIGVDLPEDTDFFDNKVRVAELIKEYIAAGLVTMGDQVESITLSNGQSFDFKFNLSNRIPIRLRLTATVSQNNLIALPSDEDVREAIQTNIEARYRMGWNFEPQRYYNFSDAPWAASLLLEWSDDDGGSWHSEIYPAEYTDLFTVDLEDIEVVFQ